MTGEDKQDPRYTTKLFLIHEHFRLQKEQLTWDRERYMRLAGITRLTVWELGALCRASVSEVDRWLTRGSFPKAVELHLTMIERLYVPSALPPPLFPLPRITDTP